MAEMTVLHFASPFAFSTPVNESRSGSPTGDDQGGRSKGDEAAKSEAGLRNGSVRDDAGLDVRDARLALMRTVDLTNSQASLGPPSTSVEAVLAAYRQEVAASDEEAGE